MAAGAVHNPIVETPKGMRQRRHLPRFLTDREVEEVRARVAAGETQVAVARAFRVHTSTVSRIVNALRRVDPFEGEP